MEIAKIDSKKKIPPKIKELMRSPYIDNVNKMLDTKVSQLKIKEYLESEGFKISKAYIGMYKNIRNTLETENNNIDKFIDRAPIAEMIENQEKELAPGSKTNKLKNDLEFLDFVIQSGADQLKTLIAENDYLITIDNVFDAIKLKDKLTDGALKGFTDFGIKNLQQITENKYMELLKSMFKHIPEENQSEVLKELEGVEEDFYKQTDYYEDYLRSIGLSEKEIQKKLKEVGYED